jgi:hypothetical protein
MMGDMGSIVRRRRNCVAGYPLSPGSIHVRAEEGEAVMVPATLRGRLIVAAALATAGFAHLASAESVIVKDRGKVDLASFECQDKTRSGFITRVCYDTGNHTLMIGFQDGTYRQYCKVDVSIANGLLSAQSMAKFYSKRIRGTGKRGPFDCRAGLKKRKR